MKLLLALISILVSTLSFNCLASYDKMGPCDEPLCIDYFKTYKKYARLGYANAMVTLGELYYHGYGTPKNVKKALKQYRMAAKFGRVKAQYNAAMIYLNDEEHQDIARGISYLKQAARKNNANSAFMLGMIFFSPDFYKQDFDQADKWLTAAYDQRFKEMYPFIEYMKTTEYFSAKHFPELFEAMEKFAMENGETNLLHANTSSDRSSAQTRPSQDAVKRTTKDGRTITSAPVNEALGDTEVITVVGRLTEIFDYEIAALRNTYPQKGGVNTGSRIIGGKTCAETIACGTANRQSYLQAVANIAGEAAMAKFGN